MIAIDLQCKNGHTFEGWFKDGKAYESQKKEGLISCPVCSVTSIERIPSTFAVKSSQTLKNHISKNLSDINAELAEIGRDVLNFVEKNFDNVGCNFADEALKIHYGVSEPRNIMGVSTEKEEKTLEKEGIKFFKVPVPISPDTDDTDT